MLWTICIVLLVLWALGLATSYTAGGLIHILLVVALVVLVIRLISGRRVWLDSQRHSADRGQAAIASEIAA